jgi:glycosyltransferase involved in cell wall biosynthesis
MSDPVGNSLRISVIICAHQPNSLHLSRTLEALRSQTLSSDAWELLVVDNQSSPPLELLESLAWHPRARCIREEQLGLTPARCCGLKHSFAQLIVFVDVDNVLQPDYLAKANEIASQHPKIGVWSGQAHPEFEDPPAQWTRPYWPMLAIREFNDDTIMMIFDSSQSLPHGAGMCIRREVATAYLNEFNHTPWRLLLERKGQSLMSGGDTDLALLALDRGWGIGHFTQLHLHHLIPPNRLTESYLLSLKESMAASGVLLDHFHRIPPPPRTSLFRRFVRFLKAVICYRGLNRRMQLAQLSGENRGWDMVSSLCKTPHT